MQRKEKEGKGTFRMGKERKGGKINVKEGKGA